MLKRTLIIAAIAAALPTLAVAQSRIPVDPWVVYGPNPVADIAPSAPLTATIPVDPWVVYGPNPVADIAPSATATAAIPVDPWVVYGPNLVPEIKNLQAAKAGR